MKRSFLLSTFLFAAVLSPAVLYGYTCVPPQEARLLVLELRVGDFRGGIRSGGVFVRRPLP